MKIVTNIDKFLTKAEGYLLVVLLGVMVILAFLQVVLRNFFSAGIVWADVLLRHVLLWLGFLGAAIATSENRHINIDALRRFLSPRVRSAVEVLTDLFAALICSLLASASWTFVHGEMADKRMVVEGVPSWYGEIIIPVGYCLLVVHFVIRALLKARAVARQEVRE